MQQSTDIHTARPVRGALLGALASGLIATQCFGPPRRELPPPGTEIASWPLGDGALVQADDDESTTYELLTPGSGDFHVRYEVSVMTPGATAYYNILRKGSGVRDWRALDLYSGTELPIRIVPGYEARDDGHPAARPDVDYLRIELARPVPEGGQTRLAIEKVYDDPRGYYFEDGFDNGQIVFARAMNIKRNAVVLPPDYELTQCNHPTRVFSEADGRVRISFDKTGQSPVFLVLKGRPLVQPVAPEPGGESVPGDAETIVRNAAATPGAAPDSTNGDGVTDPAARADLRTEGQDRELLIDLGDPRRGTFRAVHDFTETVAGRASHEISPAPPGTVARALARLLDTGETLVARVLKDGGTDGDGARSSHDVVAVDFPPLELGHTMRVRVEELRLDRTSYRIEGGELVWSVRVDSALQTLLLPSGWYLTENTLPAAVSETPDGRVRLDYVALSGDTLDLTVRGRLRPRN